MVEEHLISIQGPLTARGACGALGTLMQRGVRFKDDSCFFTIKLLGEKKVTLKCLFFFIMFQSKQTHLPPTLVALGAS